jgi:O-antigen/teichoic acid export membrane protein
MNPTINVTNARPPVKSVRYSHLRVRSLVKFAVVCCAIIAMIAFPMIAFIGLMVATAAVGIFCVTASFYGRGWIRPFSILTSVCLLLGVPIVISGPIHGPGEACVAMLVLLVVAASVGIVGAATHGFLGRRFGIVPVPNIPFLRHWLINPAEDQ